MLHRLLVGGCDGLRGNVATSVARLKTTVMGIHPINRSLRGFVRFDVDVWNVLVGIAYLSERKFQTRKSIDTDRTNDRPKRREIVINRVINRKRQKCPPWKLNAALSRAQITGKLFEMVARYNNRGGTVRSMNSRHVRSSRWHCRPTCRYNDCHRTAKVEMEIGGPASITIWSCRVTERAEPASTMR